MKITKGDIGKKVWNYIDQGWFTIINFVDDDDNTHPVIIKNLKCEQLSISRNGKFYIQDTLPSFFWEEIKPIEHKEHPMKTVTSDCGYIIYRNMNYNSIHETRSRYTKLAFAREFPVVSYFLCFSPDMKLTEVTEEVEE